MTYALNGVLEKPASQASTSFALSDMGTAREKTSKHPEAMGSGYISQDAHDATNDAATNELLSFSVFPRGLRKVIDVRCDQHGSEPVQINTWADGGA